MMLQIDKINTAYGNLQVLYDLSMEIPEGKVVTLLGRNGMGKTTLMRSIVGITPPRNGKIIFKGTDISSMESYKIARMGISYVPQGRGIFPSLSTKENLLIGARGQDKPDAWTLDRVYEFFPILKARASTFGNLLSGGEQQMLAMGRALMGNPRIILMDEPSMGLSPILVSEIFDIIKAISESGKTVLLVEQNAKKALSISDRAYVLETGLISMSGDASEIINDDRVRKAYLGE